MNFTAITSSLIYTSKQNFQKLLLTYFVLNWLDILYSFTDIAAQEYGSKVSRSREVEPPSSQYD
jgi:hypothetical protein